MAIGGPDKPEKGEIFIDSSKINGTIDEVEPNFSDDEDFVDDISDADLLPDLMKQRPKEAFGIDSVVIVDNVPIVDAGKFEKLSQVISRIFSKCGKIVNTFWPKEESGKTKGYVFIEFSNPDQAAGAVSTINGHRLDKAHTFAVNHFSDFEKYENMPEEWTPPKPQDYRDPGNLKWWLLDPDCRDQYSVLFGALPTLQINWNTPSGAPVIIEKRDKFTESHAMWSPNGSYLATFHARGVAIWGGPEFKQIQRFPHDGVVFLEFSPCERYIVTFRGNVMAGGADENLIVWDTLTGQKMRSFRSEAKFWPILKWSHDGKYFARMLEDKLMIYEEADGTFKLHENKSISVPNIRDFSWSPTENILVYWTPELDDKPARAVILQMPGRTEVCAKNLFNVKECRIHWQKGGNYLCVMVDRYSKKIFDKKEGQTKYWGIYYNFEIFRLQEKSMPVDNIEVKESVTGFEWEPVGHRFAFIHGEAPNIQVTFYSIKPGGNVELLKRLEKKQCNYLYWGPYGGHIVLAGIRTGPLNGSLEFFDVNEMMTMSTQEHFMCTDVVWDPTGRYVVSSVSSWFHKADTGYQIWSFQGRILYKSTMDMFAQLHWRPRPPSLLGDKHIREIKKNMKSFAEKFEQKDRVAQSTASQEVRERRQRQKKQFAELTTSLLAAAEQDKRLMTTLRSVGAEELDALEDEVVEFLENVEEIILDQNSE